MKGFVDDIEGMTESDFAIVVPAGARHNVKNIAMPHKMLLTRIRAEYLEMPGLRLTLEQAFGVDGFLRSGGAPSHG